MSKKAAEELRARALENIKSAQTSGDKEAEGKAWVQLSGARRLINKSREATYALEQALACFQDAEAPVDVARALLHLSFFHRAQGDPDSADHYLARVKLDPEQMPPDLRAFFREQDLYRTGRADDKDAFLAAMAATAEASLEADDAYQAVRFSIARVEQLELLGRMEEADALAEELLADERLQSDLKEFQRLRMVQVARLLRAERDEAANALLAEIGQLCVDKQWPMVEIRARCTAATVWIERGLFELANTNLERASAIALKVVDPPGYATCTKLTAMMHIAKGERPEAIGALLSGKTTLNDLKDKLGDLTFDVELDELKHEWGEAAFEKALETFYRRYDVVQ